MRAYPRCRGERGACTAGARRSSAAARRMALRRDLPIRYRAVRLLPPDRRRAGRSGRRPRERGFDVPGPRVRRWRAVDERPPHGRRRARRARLRHGMLQPRLHRHPQGRPSRFGGEHPLLAGGGSLAEICRRERGEGERVRPSASSLRRGARAGRGRIPLHEGPRRHRHGPRARRGGLRAPENGDVPVCGTAKRSPLVLAVRLCRTIDRCRIETGKEVPRWRSRNS